MMIWRFCRYFSAVWNRAGAVDPGLNVMLLFIISSTMVICTIMRTAVFNAQDLQRVLQQRTVCTFEQLADTLGTSSRMTVFRKLAELSYLTSYSHRGQYATLRPSSEFDPIGLWSHR